MDTYKTLNEARTAKGKIAHCILEIEHKDSGICFVGSKCGIKAMQYSIDHSPKGAIIRTIAEHDCRTDAQVTIDAEMVNAEMDKNRRCDRCGTHVAKTVYSQKEGSQWGPVTVYYCDSCRQLLTSIGAGEHTAMQERADERQDNTPVTKED
jgi:hypothetical protein